jgi:hypothetical protein
VPNKTIKPSGVLIGDVLKTTPVATYTVTGNTEYVISAVDVSTNKFTCNNHGMANGTIIYPILNNSTDLLFSLAVFAGGLAVSTRYYVINQSTNDFELSLTNGGASIDVVTNATMDLTKWHFEKIATTNLTISSLPAKSKYKVIINGRRLGVPTFASITPNGLLDYTSEWLNSTAAAYTNPVLPVTECDMGIFLTILIDYVNILSMSMIGVAYKCSSATAKTTTAINTTAVSPKYRASTITSVYLGNNGFANGTTVEVYNA